MKRTMFIVGILALTVVTVIIAVNFGGNNVVKNGKISVVTTLFPLYDFARNIGGDKISATLLLPPGVEAHVFEPKPSDVVRINQSDLFVYTGKFMEPWAEDIVRGISGKEVKIVDSSAGVDLINERGGTDPHIWLGFENAMVMADNILKAILEEDPANARYYRKNTDDYKNKLAGLDNDYKKALLKCQDREIVYGGHYAFGYLARRYGLKYEAAYGISPDSEPSAKDLAGLIEQIKKEKIQYVFYEELVSPKLAETLAQETGAQLLLLNPAHNITRGEYDNGATFISIMENNLKNLSKGLRCEK
ncbi:zinc ABC transporter substrate-binding protein [Candidatus Peregrinibacteria bacterium]|nr:zinc ABC transporter substrate-binding protein [Candidatus Peregrinibacteria bacterium]